MHCRCSLFNSSRCLSSQQIWSTPKERKCLSKSVIRKTFEGMASIMLWCSRTGPQSLTAFTSVHLQLRPVYVTCVCVCVLFSICRMQPCGCDYSGRRRRTVSLVSSFPGVAVTKTGLWFVRRPTDTHVGQTRTQWHLFFFFLSLSCSPVYSNVPTKQSRDWDLFSFSIICLQITTK